MAGLGGNGVGYDGEIEDRHPEEAKDHVVSDHLIVGDDARLTYGEKPASLGAITRGQASLVHEIGIFIDAVHRLAGNVERILGFQHAGTRRPLGMNVAITVRKPTLPRANVVMDFLGRKVTQGIVEGYMPAGNDLARVIVHGSLVGRHPHAFIAQLHVATKVVDVLILFLSVGQVGGEWARCSWFRWNGCLLGE